MEKILLKRKTVMENGIVINKWKCSKKILNHPKNEGKPLELGWNIELEGNCNNGCPEPTTEGHWDCIGGQCIFVPWG